MTKKIRVLIVDDSVLACKMISDTISQDPGLEVAGTALSGPLALTKLSQSAPPDVVMLDIAMPGMDGLQTLGEIKKSHPKLPVIMCSALTETGNRYAMQALLNGASDYVTKPNAQSRANGGMETFSKELLAKIKASVSPEDRLIKPVTPVIRETRVPSGSRFQADIVAIGVSTGGPKALADLLPQFPADFPVPLVIVQHMPPNFTKSLSETLAKKSLMEILEGVPGAMVEPGKAYIAPGGFHMRVVKRRAHWELALDTEPPVNSCRPSVDVLFQSVAEAFGSKSLGVVLTGMGQDGLAGAEAIRKAGGSVFVQDESSSVVWGMPGSIAKAGLANKVLALKDIPLEVMAALSRKKPRAGSEPPTADPT